MGYYDPAHTQLKVQGRIEKGSENGLWEYYDEDGSLVQYGDYSNGIPEGIWVYTFPLFDTSVIWKPYHDILGKFTLSLPESFQEYKLDVDSSGYTSVDIARGNVFSARDLGVTSQNEYENYFEKTKAEFSFDSELINSSSIVVQADSMSYFFDKFSIRNKEKKIGAIHYDLYTLINNRMIIISYTCRPQDSIKSKFFI